jgi:hypothetical protein
MKCAKCGAENHEGAKFCNECAGLIEASCPKVRCETTNRAPNSATNAVRRSAHPPRHRQRNKMIHRFEWPIAAAENLEGERKMVTALCVCRHQGLDRASSRTSIPEEARLEAFALKLHQGRLTYSPANH